MNDFITQIAPLEGDTTAMPDRIGGYAVRGRLGEGATSEVFLAFDDFHERPVAIKRARRAAVFDAAEVRFRDHFFAAEAALVGQLNHPNIVQIYDAVDDPLAPYLVMEYVPGTTLKDYCRPESLLSLEQIVEVGFKCAMALGFVARHGLIHRDVKPANLLAVVEDGQVLEVKITDFGSALNLNSDRTQVVRVGSLPYMSPEQLDGATLDSRADQYSLAAVLYHLIAGRPPFEAPNQSALMNRIYHDRAPSLTTLRGGVPPALDALLQRALAKTRLERFPDWDNFAQELAAMIARREVPRGATHDVLDSERFNLLRTLEFFKDFGDVELWEVVHRARWQRHELGDALYRKGQVGSTFHIIASGRIEVFRDGHRVALLGAGTSVGEMMYLAPSPDLRIHSADVIVTDPATTISFTPELLEQLNPATRHLFDAAFIRVLVRRLHAAHQAMQHPRRIV